MKLKMKGAEPLLPLAGTQEGERAGKVAGED